MNRYLAVLGFILLSLYHNAAAWGQGALGERQFYNQLNSVRNQVRPHFNQARQQLGQLRRQGVNTSGWERQLNYVESQLNNMRWTGPTGGSGGTGFHTINPFGDYLFHGVPIRPGDGKLVTRHLDPTGLAARAEEWAKELRDFNRDLSARQGEEKQKYLSDINEKLTQLAAVTNEQLQLASLGGGQELKPQTLGEELSLAGLPRLEGDTPALLRDPFGRDDPMLGPGGPILEPREMDRPSIDRIEVPSPAPQVSALDACAGGTVCVAGVVASQGWDWLKDQYWDARVWANDPMHREWLGDAVTIATLPLMFGDALALVGARTAGGTLGARAAASSEAVIWMAGDSPSKAFELVRVIGQMEKAAAEAAYVEGGGQPFIRIFGETRKELGKVGQLTADQDAALQAIAKKYDIPFRIMGSKAEVERGLETRADPLLREFLPDFRSQKWQSTGSDLDLHIFPEVAQEQGWRKTLAMTREIREVFTGKYSGETGLSVDLHGYSRRYRQDINQLPSISYGPDGRSQTLGWGAPLWEPKFGTELGEYSKLKTRSN